MGRFNVLKSQRETAAPASAAGSSKATRRGNPAYRQFSAYIPVDLYRQLKVTLAAGDMDLSEAVERAVSEWLAKQGSKT
ncbi:MAG TPA: hypothetical protein VN538_00040 [Clostridia bacterium]|nr:hypothetical protein [Clostridia bacterium]